MLIPTKTIRQNYEEDLRSLIELPTVSADPDSHVAIEQIAAQAAKLLERIGMQVEILPTDGNPLIYGEYIGKHTWPTVLLYNHLDVQPADPKDWGGEDPFRMRVQNNAFYGRGATDDKGPALVGLYAIEHAIHSNVPLNFKVLWETEEEIGSVHFAPAIQRYITKLAAVDSVLISDTLWTSATSPSIIYALRGLLAFEISLQTGVKDVHSGSAGGVAINPLNTLATIIASCTDPKTGKVVIPGFYDSVTPPTQEEIKQFKHSGFSLKQFTADNELYMTSKHDGIAALSALMAEPTFDVHGISGGYIGSGVKTIIPYHATATISSRLVAGQTPEKAFEAIETFVTQQCPMAKLRLLSSASPYISDMHGKHAQAIAAAYRETLQLEPSFVREGGSIGAVPPLAEATSAPIILAGLSLPDDGYHTINEHFRWSQAERGMRLFSSYFERIAQLPKLG